ncbi:hypothetical protein GCM10027020_32290 [Nocardioides salsibiostraticola]
MASSSAWDLTTLNNGLMGALIGVVGAVLVSTTLTLYSLRRTERAHRSAAFEEAMLRSAEDLSIALVELRYKFDPVLADNFEHELALAPGDVIDWAGISRTHSSALAVDGRPYRDAAERLAAEICLFTDAALSAAGRDEHSRQDAYGWHYERSDSYDSILQAADEAMAGWADCILRGLAELRRGSSPQVARPPDLSLTGRDGEQILDAAGFKRSWFPKDYLVCDALELEEDEAARAKVSSR